MKLKRNIHKRGFGYGAHVETEVTEGTMKRFRGQRKVGNWVKFRDIEKTISIKI